MFLLQRVAESSVTQTPAVLSDTSSPQPSCSCGRSEPRKLRNIYFVSKWWWKTVFVWESEMMKCAQKALKKKERKKNDSYIQSTLVTLTEDTRRMWAVRGRQRGLTAIRHLPSHRVAARPLEWGSSPESYVTVTEIGPTTEPCWWKGLCGGWRWWGISIWVFLSR